MSLENIKVRFFEVDEDDRVVWENFGRFTEADVHHQYAIALKTPPYRRTNIDENVGNAFQIQLHSNEFMPKFVWYIFR